MLTTSAESAEPTDKFIVSKEPYYLPAGSEIELFEAAYGAQLPVMLKGPTGCGKTRFVEHMAWRQRRPLVTIACHEDLSATDLVGRFLLEGDETVWHDGPLTTAVKSGAICYLDEVVEARKDTIVLIHPLTDDRRILPIEKRGSLLQAPEQFILVVSYNPGYQSVLKDLKQSTRQRFIAIEFDYPQAQAEAQILMHEGGISAQDCSRPRPDRPESKKSEGSRTRGRRVNPAARLRSTTYQPWNTA